MRWAIALLCLGALLAGPRIAAAANDATAPTRPKVAHVVTVTIENMAFSPSHLTVHTGDQVVFSNKDLFPHTATADDKSFDSGGIAPDGTWKYTAAAGTHTYKCAFHPTMHGAITVR